MAACAMAQHGNRTAAPYLNTGATTTLLMRGSLTVAVSLQGAPSKVESGVGTCCLYFSAPNPPTPQGAPGNILYLNGEGKGIVNNMCIPSEVSPTYAPPGRSLISISTVGKALRGVTHVLCALALHACFPLSCTAWPGCWDAHVAADPGL